MKTLRLIAFVCDGDFMTQLGNRLRRDDQESRYSPRLLMTIQDMEAYYDQATREQRQGALSLAGEGRELSPRKEEGSDPQTGTTETRPSL